MVPQRARERSRGGPVSGPGGLLRDCAPESALGLNELGRRGGGGVQFFVRGEGRDMSN